MPEQYRFAAFISYSSKDAKFAKRLHAALERYGIPNTLGKFDLQVERGKRNRIYPVFRDREELAAGDLSERIEGSLKASAALIVVCSPGAAASPWVEKEIQSFLALGRRQRIFAIIADDAPLFDASGADATTLCFPPAFRGDALVDAKALEPLAADARKGKDGFRNAWLKVVAGLIGVTPGQLIDRDTRLRRGRMVRATGVAALAIAAVGAVFAYQKELTPIWAKYTKYWGRVMSAQVLAALKPGETFQDCSKGSKDCPVMVVVPAGKFLMGAPDDERDLDYERLPGQMREVSMSLFEGPQHEVSIQRFAVSETEITFDDWKACVGGGGCRSQPSPADASWGHGTQPVINVTWDNAKEYVKWLSEMTGAEYRLLSEAEWEYAARAGSTTRWSYGDDEAKLGEFAWFLKNSGEQAHAVRQKRPNAYGLYDMHGNVWEWVEDCVASYDPAKQDGSAVETDAKPDGAKAASTCSNRVLRGGSWYDGAGDLRSADRSLYIRSGPSYRLSGIGFRLARSAPGN